MRDQFDRDALPDPTDYFESRGFSLVGRGAWRTTRCAFHGGSDSMRVKVRSGAWCCMACGASGGDVLAFHMQATGMDFVQAARDLGAWNGPERTTNRRGPADLSARDALELAAWELLVAQVVMGDARRGVLVCEEHWQRFLLAVHRVERLAREVRS